MKIKYLIFAGILGTFAGTSAKSQEALKVSNETFEVIGG